MGRGLSDLQKRILILAYTDHGETNTRGQEKPLYYYEIFKNVYGWSTKINDWAGPSSQRFKPSEIGEKAYRAAKVTVHKSCRRLESRGLITIVEGTYAHWKGLLLTDAGRELTANLVADSATKLTNKV